MRSLRPEERSAADAVARHFSATWPEGGTHLKHGGRKIAVAFAALAPRNGGRAPVAKPRLRYDRVALRVIRDLRARLRPLLANGETLILTARAPILQAGKTVNALEERLRSRRAGKSRTAALKARIFGNQIGIRLLPNAGRGSQVLVFVHSEGSKPGVIANAAQCVLECLRAKAGSAGTAAGKERWLILLGPSALAETCRDACAQLSGRSLFAKIVLVADGAKVEALA